jgi:hypothetical protein
LADLDALSFARRERASAELRGLGPAIEESLRAALERGPSPESHRRLHQLLKAVTGPGERARPVRAVQALEYAKTDEAKALLKELAAGPTDGLTTREAKSSLERLSR